MCTRDVMFIFYFITWQTGIFLTFLLLFIYFFLLDRATVVAAAAFLDAFQKVADLATNSRGRDEGKCVCVCVRVCVCARAYGFPASSWQISYPLSLRRKHPSL